ncbi:MAG: NUDIX domain-containing protein [Acidobacteriota bacterium]
MAKSPWQVVAGKVVYENPWIRLTHQEVIRPDGQPGIYGIVHFRHRAVGILPIDDRGWTWLVGQYRLPLDRYSWEIPEGGCPEGESILEAARRELREETGLTANHWLQLGEADLSNSVTDEHVTIFLATDLVAGAPDPEGTEVLSLRHLPFAEALQMVVNGEITDAISIMAILHYQLLSNQRHELQPPLAANLSR